MIKLFAFLGNYGAHYESTRHNAAWIFSRSLSLSLSSLSYSHKFTANFASFTRGAEKVFFIFPLTYMNNSGISVAEAAIFYKIKAQEILVIHDELELPLGFVSLKFSGGLGGHNGLRSIKARLGSADFWRLRLGIGRPENEERDIADYVLSPFSEEEMKIFDKASLHTAPLVESLISGEDAQSFLEKWKKVNAGGNV